MRASETEDLTGAALVALMRLSFSEQGITLPAGSIRTLPNSPHASLAGKNALAEWVLAQHGPVALLRVGQSVPRMRFDPIGAALLAAADGPDLVRRWNRLERYVHTRHPIEVRALDQGSAELAHFGNPGDPPSQAIDLVLAGLLAGLLQAVGCKSLTVTVGEAGGARDVMTADALVESLDGVPRPSGLWRFRWASTERVPLQPPKLFTQPDQPVGRLAREVVAMIEKDLMATPSLEQLAESLGQSTRSLQRRLAEDGLSLQAIRRAAQIRRASAMLIEGRASLSAIGFTTGFADAAHFARAFRKATGFSPRAFRDAARAPGTGAR